MNCRALLLMAVLAMPAFAAPASDVPLEARLQSILVEEQLTGAAWAIVSEGVIQTGAAGFANAADAIPFTPSMRFHVGSVTKAVLATGVLRLATQGRLELDEPVTRYLPGIRFDNPWSATDPVTVRHLLDHTAGLSDARLSQMFSARVIPDQPLIDAFTREDLRVRSRPGSRLSYSNVGYGLLGLLIETVTGMRYEHYLDRHLLAPLGMHDSTFAYTTQQGAAADPALAWGHLDDGTPHPAVPVVLRPAAQLTTTAHDFGVFARFLMGDGRIGGETFIAPGLMRARGHASTTEAAAAGLEAGYALGLSRRDRDGAAGYCHGGNIIGFVALLCAYPDAGKAFAISVNTDSETADYGRVFELFSAHLGLPQAMTMPAGTPAEDTHEWNGWYALEPNRFQQFAYLDAMFGNLAARFDGEVMRLTALPGNTQELRPYGGHLFIAPGRINASHVLMKTASGTRLISDGYRTYAEVSPRRVFARWISLAAALLGLLWFTIAGGVAILKHRRNAWRRAEFLPFAGVLALLLPLPLFLTQPFMAIGDLTAASGLLALATGLLPVIMLAALWRFRLTESRPWRAVHAVFAICVLQWCLVLAAWDMLPLILWR